MIYSNKYNFYDGYIRCEIKLDISKYTSGNLKVTAVDAETHVPIRILSTDYPSHFDNGNDIFYINENASIDVADYLEELNIAENTGDWEVTDDNRKIRIYRLLFDNLGEKENEH